MRRTNRIAKRSVVLIDPSLGVESGVSTHIRQLLFSDLADEFELRHLKVGREGRRESTLAGVCRLIVGPR